MKKTKTLKEHLITQSNDYSSVEKEFKKLTGDELVADPFVIPKSIPKNKMTPVSIIIPSHNSASTIKSCLISIEKSSFNIKYGEKLEVIVVDDGSTDNTWKELQNENYSINLKVMRQKHLGQSKALNTGASIADGKILVFCDADMVLSYYSIEQLALRNLFVSNALFVGFRSDMDKRARYVDASYIRKHGIHKDPFFIFDERIRFFLAGWPENMCLVSNHFKKLGNYKKLWMPDAGEPWFLFDLVYGALFSVSKKTFEEIGGFYEGFKGWGCSDGFLAAKAISKKNYIIPVYCATGIHISHPARSRNKWHEYKLNRLKLKSLINEELKINKKWQINAKKRIISTMKNNYKQNKSKRIKNSKLDRKWNEIDSNLAIGNYRKALNILIRSTNFVKDSEFSLRLGKSYFGLRMYKESISELKKTKNKIDVVRSYAAQGNYKKALLILDDPKNNIPKFWLNTNSKKFVRLGNNYFIQGMHETALRCYEAALIKSPENDVAIKYRIKCLNIL